jgi:chromosome partitioning protein
MDTEKCEPNLVHCLVAPEGVRKSASTGLTLLKAAIFETPIEGLDLVGADVRLAQFEREPASAVHRLRQQLASVASEYDIVFLDCAPSLGDLLHAALFAADYVLIPCAALHMSLEGLTELVYTIGEVRHVNKELQILGSVINLYKPRRLGAQEARRAVEEISHLVGPVFDTNLHDFAEIADAHTRKRPVIAFAGSSKAAEQISLLTDEFLMRLKMPKSAEDRKQDSRETYEVPTSKLNPIAKQPKAKNKTINKHVA